MTLFPAFLKLQDRPILVVGGGAIAFSKVPGLLEAGAKITLVAPKLNCDIAELVRDRRIEWLPKPFEPADLSGKFLVVAATSLRDVNESVFQEADKRHILCNAVDDMDHCHFYYGSLVQRGDLQIAISTNGKSPALAQRLRKELEQQFGPEYTAWLEWLGAAREALRAQSTDPEARKRQLHLLASRPMFERFLRESNEQSPDNGEVKTTLPGKVFLIGAGPGDPDLLTQKAARVLQSAHIVLHDSLVGPEILALIPKTAQRIDVGKRAGFRLLTQSDINALLVDAAHTHEIVVRLKGGDPLIFGRAAEEIESLRAARISFEIVPGISAAFSAAAVARVSLTDRRLASRVLFTTYSRTEEARAFSGVPIAPDTTVVVYMPGQDYSGVSRWLTDSGLAAETPCLVISKASQTDQSTRLATLATLSAEAPLPAPALLIVGRVAVHSAATATAAANWFEQRTLESPEKISIS
jgi:uroporphyrin-III C-methyltransferase / precorrin-2 dehydrogenase / sirohydrochlorin ferrochelatase